MKRTLLFSAFLFLAMPLIAAAQTSLLPPLNDEQAVRSIVDTYLNGTDPAVKKQLFSDNAKIISTVNNKVTETPAAGSYRPKRGERVAASLQKITGVEVTKGGALVKVETGFLTDMKPAVSPQPHIQYISLLKTGAGWKIVSILMPPLSFEK